MKDILVHLDGGTRTAVRLDMSIQLAQKFEARLTGLFAQIDSDRISAAVHQSSPFLAVTAAKARDEFANKTAKAGIATRWWQLSHGDPVHVASEMGFCARYADLVVMGQPDPSDKRIPRGMAEQTIVECGRPVMIVPPCGDFQTVGNHIVLAWNASREAVRAMADSRALLSGAQTVTVLSLKESGVGGTPGEGLVPPVDIIDHLGAWGISAKLERNTISDVDRMDFLLSRLCDLGADLLVMGGHNRHGLATPFATSTQYMLEHLTIPVLMSW